MHTFVFRQLSLVVVFHLLIVSLTNHKWWISHLEIFTNSDSFGSVKISLFLITHSESLWDSANDRGTQNESFYNKFSKPILVAKKKGVLIDSRQSEN